MSVEKINDLIANLASQTEVKKQFNANMVFFKWLLITFAYLLVISIIFGVRANLTEKFNDIGYSIEILCLLLLVTTSLYSSIKLALPDFSQNKSVLFLPIIGVFLLAIFLFFICIKNENILPIDHIQGVKCIACITIASIIPSLLLFFEVKKAATTKPNLLVFYVIIYATSLSALALRLEPSEPSIYQTIIYHYLPIIIFSVFSLLVPKKFLNW